MASLSEILAEYEANKAILDGREPAQETKRNKAVAALLRQKKGLVNPDQHAALDAEIARLDPTE